MKLCRCPICHSDIHLDQLLEDDAGRELLTLITKCKYDVARPLIAYISLFRPEKSGLANSRAVKLINEVFALYPQSLLLAHALSETVQAVQNKRRSGANYAPLTNHNYLKQVYETNAPKFAGTAGDQMQTKDVVEQQKREEEQRKINDTIMYIDRLYHIGQAIEHLAGYDIWLSWKQEQERLNGNA